MTTASDQAEQAPQHPYPPLIETATPVEEGAYWLRRNIMSLVIIFAIVFGVKETVIGSYRIPSRSMDPTLQVGDLLFTWNLSYGFRVPFVFTTFVSWSTPDRHDIVVFRRDDDPFTAVDETKTNLVKRVIGLPGDTIEVRGNRVLLNGKPLNEPYAVWGRGGLVDFDKVTVPEGHLFLMGDNRDFSKDSRLWLSGPFLPIENVRGQAVFVYFSLNSLSRIFTILR